MKKLVIALGILSACANSDAMQDGGLGDRSTNRRTFVSGAALFNDGPVMEIRRASCLRSVLPLEGNGDLLVRSIPDDHCLACCASRRDVVLLNKIYETPRKTVMWKMSPQVIEDEIVDDYCLEYKLPRIETLKLHAGINRIGVRAFMNQVFLKSLTVPASVVLIDNDSFKDCVSLSRIFFEEGSVLDRIGDRAFAMSEDMSIKVWGSRLQLKEVWFPRSLRELGDECFVRRRGLSRIMFEEGSKLESIGRGAFAETGIKRLTIPSSVEVLDDYCFCGLVLEELRFEPGSILRQIGAFAFCYNHLSKINLPDSVQFLGEASFYQACRNSFVVNISVGSQLSDVDARVFPHYAEIIDESGRVLSSPDFDPNPTTVMGSNLYWSANTWIRGPEKILVIPNTIQKIDDCCFQNMDFDRIDFASGSQVRVLGKRLFVFARINSPLRIPDSVEEIKEKCFCSMCEDSDNFAIIFGAKSNLQTVGKDAFMDAFGEISGGIIVHSQRVYDLIYQNLAESYGLEQSPQGVVLSYDAPQLILESEEESSSEE